MTKRPIDRRRRPSDTKPSKRKLAAPEAVRDDEHQDDLPRQSKSRQRPIPAKSPAAGERRKRSKSKTAQAAMRRRRTSNDTRDYAVGRGKPPPEYTWKPGESGNKKGRPIGSKNESTIWKEIMRRKIKMPIAGKLKTVTIQEAIQYRIANDALNGSVKSANFVLNRLAGIIGDIADTNLSEDDLAVLNAYKRQIKKEIPDDDDD